MTTIVLKYLIASAKRKREKASIRWLYIWSAVLGAAVYPWAAWKAYLWRGYKAIGGEILIPIVAVMIVAFVRQIANIKKSMPEATDTDKR